jgi:5-methylcytosine-specific restriction endonuclease McrA
MGKLSLLKPSIGTLANRLEPLPEERRRQYERTRRATTEWRAWYGTQRWKDLRQSILARDHYKCQITGVMLLGKYPAANSPVVDHKTPHRGDPDLFWDPNNLHAVSRDWHDTTKQAMERGGQATSHPEWFKPSLIPLTIVCGPPASGKSSYVAARAQQGDLIIDLDVIASTIAGTDLHNWDRDRYLNEALYRRNDIIGGLSRPSARRQHG